MDESKVEFGRFLAAARQKTGRSLEQTARFAKVATHHLEALEHGRIESLPTGVYRRALLRSYASAVGLDPKATLDRFERAFGPVLPPLGISEAPAGKTESALWYLAISRFAGGVRRAVGLAARTAWQGGFECRW